ncbi:CTP:molybdopterin cytidylyltransferase MocA [Cryobacterium sp. CAN_C3]|nr:CTP:molybdopterin cytidylyltransferase MocA [Cryobacterium sp. CAN_C3]
MQMPPPPSRTAGLVLAAGAGSRYGRPKALVYDAAGHSWLQHAVEVLTAGGCSPVIVVLGARGAEAAALLEPTASVLVVEAADWADGLSASLRAGLRCAAALPAVTAVAVIPVDVPDLNAETVARVIGTRISGTRISGANNDSDGTLRQARFAGQPGHPVVIGRAHWTPLIATAAGDTGAGPYLRAHEVEAIECGDLGTGIDIDRPN